MRLYSLSRRISEERADYYQQLERGQKGNADLTEWQSWLLGCIERAIGQAINDVDQVLAKSRFWVAHAGTPLNERQRKVVNRMLDQGPGGFEGGISTRKYASLARCSPATAQRDLSELLAAGLLSPRPGAGRSASYEISWPPAR